MTNAYVAAARQTCKISGHRNSLGLRWLCLVALDSRGDLLGHLAALLTAFLRRLCPLCEPLMHDRIDHPVRRIPLPWRRHDIDPAQCFELLEYLVGLMPLQFAHGL